MKAVVFRGEVLDGYFIDSDGNIYSNKSGKMNKISVYNKGSESSPYPRVHMMVNGKKKTLLHHRVVCENFVEVPMADILTEKEWLSIKKPIREKLLKHIQHVDQYQVNHIDHDHKNYHPSNLEWVTSSENQQKYQTFRKTGTISE